MKESDLTRDQLLEMLDVARAESRRLEEELRQIKLRKKYGLVWEDRPEAIEQKYAQYLPILQVDKQRNSIKGTSKEPLNHLLVEADNLEALLSLQLTHRERIDLIYIDPPYNTGNKDFKYNDHYIDKEDIYRHSTWLSFMEKRLKLAKSLLKDSGVIFISIDDYEYAQLKLLSDEVFGERNYVATFIWKKTDTPSNLSNKVRSCTEYILCYEKRLNTSRKYAGLRQGGQTDAPILNKSNTITTLSIPATSIEFNDSLKGKTFKKGVRKNKKDEDNNIELLADFTVGKSTHMKLKGRFRWSQNFLDEQIQIGTKLFCKSEKLSLRYLKPASSYSKMLPITLLDKSEECGTNEDASNELLKMGLKFSNPKPVSLIKYLIKMVGESDCLVLDFFAGSGTTGQAVLEVNAEDGGAREFILVTNNENKIFDEVTLPRLKKTNLNGDHIHILKPLSVEKVFELNIESYASDLVKIIESSFDVVEEKSTHTVLSNWSKTICIVNDPFDFELIDTLIKRKLPNMKLYLLGSQSDLPVDGHEYLASSGILYFFIPKDQIENYKRAIRKVQNKNNN